MTTLRTGLRIASSSARTVRPVIPHSARGPLTRRAPATPFARALSTVPPTVDPDVPPKPNTAEQLKTQTDAKYKPMYIFGALTSIGLLITIYSLVEYYFALPKWPDTVRTPLRRALRAKSLGDLERSEGFFKEALTAALALPPSEFAPDPLLKLSGLYITYAVLLEDMKKRSEAYVLLREGLDHFGPQALSPDALARRSGAWAGEVPLSQEDHIRAIGLAQKLGHLSLQLATASRMQIYPSKEDGPKTWLDASEKHLSDALTAMLKLGLTTPTAENGKTPRVIAGRDVNLPDARAPEDEQEVQLQGGSVDKKGLGVTMEALAEIYARKGEYSIAGNLLIQAISTLLPPKTSEPPPIPDQCQAAMLMTTISSHALQPNTTKAIKASRSWSLRALQISDQAIQANQGGNADTLICSKALAVGSYNLGMLAEMEGDLKEALVQFDRSLKTSRTISFTEGSRLATESIQRVRALSSTNK